MYTYNTREMFALNLALQALDEDLQRWRQERRERRAARRAVREASRPQATAVLPPAKILRPAAH